MDLFELQKEARQSKSIKEVSSELFSSYKFNGKHRDIPYNELLFPKIILSPENKHEHNLRGSTEMDSLWLVGILDTSERSSRKEVCE